MGNGRAKSIVPTPLLEKLIHVMQKRRMLDFFVGEAYNTAILKTLNETTSSPCKQQWLMFYGHFCAKWDERPPSPNIKTTNWK